MNTNEPVSQGKRKNKRLREGQKEAAAAAAQEEQDSNFKMVTHYRPILHVDFLGPGELLVVERPLIDVLATLPPAYFKPKYGVS